MSSFNKLAELSSLASDGEKQEGMSSFVQEALATHKANTQKEAAEEIVKLLQKMEEEKMHQRQSIKAAKRMAKNATNQLDNIDRAWAFGEETQNFLPIMQMMGVIHFTLDTTGMVTKVPESWKPKQDK